MRFPSLSPVLLVFFALLVSRSAIADGGSVLTQQIVGPWRVTVFGAPTPMRAGPADISVLLQDPETGNPQLGETISVAVTPPTKASPNEAWVPPCCSMKKPSRAVSATHELAQNKLLYAANVILPASGSQTLHIQLGSGNSMDVPIVVAPPPPPLEAYWAYLVAPPLLIAGFALNQRLRRRPPAAR